MRSINAYVREVLFERRLQPVSVEQFKRSIVNWFKVNSLSDQEFEHNLRMFGISDRAVWERTQVKSISASVRVLGDNVSVTVNQWGTSPSLIKTWDSHNRTLAQANGWYLNRKDYDDNSSAVYVFEPSHGEKKGTPSTVYHVAPSEITDRISRVGLVPNTPQSSKSSSAFKANRFYPNRVYVATSVELASALKQRFERDEKKSYVVFKIDTEKLARGTKFYQDSEESDSLYTYSSVPPKAVSRL